MGDDAEVVSAPLNSDNNSNHCEPVTLKITLFYFFTLKQH